VQLDLNPRREVLAGFVVHHVPTGYQKQALIAFKEKPGCISEVLAAIKGQQTGNGKEY
jgi:hypothetical protein